MSDEDNDSQPEFAVAVVDTATCLLQVFSTYDVNRFVSTNGVNVLLGALKDSTIPLGFLNLFKSISATGKIGKLALIDANGFQERLESTFSDIIKSLVSSSIARLDANDITRLQTTCDDCILMVDLGQEMRYYQNLQYYSCYRFLNGLHVNLQLKHPTSLFIFVINS